MSSYLIIINQLNIIIYPTFHELRYNEVLRCIGVL